MKHLKTKAEKKGEFFIFASLFLWSFFPIMMAYSFLSVGPLFSAAMSSFFAAIFFLFCVCLRFKKTNFRYALKVWENALLGAFMVGCVFYAILFWGASMTSAGNVAIFGLMEIFFTFLFLNVLWKHEKFFWPHFLGAIAMVLGAVLILFQDMERTMNWGDLIIILAVMIPPLGNHYQKKAIAKMDVNFYMFFRSFLSFIFISLCVWLWEELPTWSDFRNSLWFLVLNGTLLLGLSKTLSMEGLKRLPVTKTISLTPLSVFLTLILAYFLMGEVPGWWKILGGIPIVIGTLLILKPAENVYDEANG